MKKQEIKEKIEHLFADIEFEASDRIELVDEKSINGDTYKIKDAIRKMGGKWNSRNKRWKLGSKVKAELIVEVASQKVALIVKEQYQKRKAEQAAKHEASIMEVVEEYSMTDEQHSAFRGVVSERRRNRRFKRLTVRGMTKSFLDQIADQRDPEAVYKEEQEVADRKQEVEEAKRIKEEAMRRQEEKRLLKEAETLKKADYFQEITGVEAEELLRKINNALKLLCSSKRKGYMLASDKQIFRGIQGEVGSVIDMLKDKNYSNTELLEFYDHNDNRMDRIDDRYLSLNHIINLNFID